MTEIDEMETQLGSILAALDLDAVPLSEVPGLWSEFDELQRLARSAMALLARRIEASSGPNEREPEN